MRVRTCEAIGVVDAFTRVRDTCEVLVSAVARLCVRYSDVLYVCMYTMLDSTTLTLHLGTKLVIVFDI